MNRDITRATLEHLAECGKLMIDAFFPKYYPGTGPVRRLFDLDHVYYPSKKSAKHSLSSTLYYLKKEGFVARTGPKKKAEWTITKKGIKNLKITGPNKLTNRITYDLPPVDGILRLVTFDIPENKRKQRNWLRTELIACDFSMLHKSVFIGKRPLPEEVIKKIDYLRLSKYIHIMTVNKSGTLANKKL